MDDIQKSIDDIDVQIHKAHKHLESLQIQRRQMYQGIFVNLEKSKELKLAEIENQQNNLRAQIAIKNSEMKEKNEQLKKIMLEIRQLQTKVEALQKEKCPITGHCWGWDTYEQGGPLE